MGQNDANPKKTQFLVYVSFYQTGVFKVPGIFDPLPFLTLRASKGMKFCHLYLRDEAEQSLRVGADLYSFFDSETKGTTEDLFF